MFYIMADENNKKQCLSEDEGDMIINVGVWWKLDLLLVDPNNKGILYLQEQYGDRIGAVYEFRPDQDFLESYNEVYEWVGDGSWMAPEPILKQSGYLDDDFEEAKFVLFDVAEMNSLMYYIEDGSVVWFYYMTI